MLRKIIFFSITVSGLFLFSCESEKLPKPLEPRIAEETTDLEALYYTEEKISLNSSIWDEVDYVNVVLTDDIMNVINDEIGLLNANGTYNGLAGFNKGDTISMSLRALYDDENIYVLVRWNDQTANTSSKTWKYNSFPDPKKPGEDTAGWTSHYAPDNFSLYLTNKENKTDVWHWDAAISAPLSYAIDRYLNDANEEVDDSGKPMFFRNSVDGTNRGGPKYEWGGNTQNMPLASGDSLPIDAAYYLVDTMSFKGMVSEGLLTFNNECAPCHGEHGNGEISAKYPSVYADVAFSSPYYSSLERNALLNTLTQDWHDGAIHITRMNETERLNLMAYLRGLSGVPGYVLQQPDGSMANVRTESSFNTFKVIQKHETPYEIMFIRKLSTNNDDDVSINPLDTLQVKVFVSDADNNNRIKSSGIILKFFEEE